jgi:hypothetical protein
VVAAQQMGYGKSSNRADIVALVITTSHLDTGTESLLLHAKSANQQ